MAENLTPGSMSAAGGPLTDAETVMTAPGSAPGQDPAAAPAADERQLDHAAPAAGRAWDDLSGRRKPWKSWRP